MSKKRSYLLISPVSTDESVSMRLYAVGIADIVRKSGCNLTVLRSVNIRKPRILSKIFEAILRYVYYPVFIIRSPAGTVHITDHTYSFLIPVVKLAGKRCIVTLHNNLDDVLSDDVWKRHRDIPLVPVLSKFLFALSLQQLQSADRVICVSRSIKTSLERRGFPQKILSLVAPPISDSFFSPLSAQERRSIKEQRDKKGKAFYILHVGNNDPAHKNIEHILRVLIELRRQKINAFFVKAGEPFVKSQMQFIAREHLQKYILHLGNLSQSSIKLVYHYADVLLFPSYYEGCPAVPFEAMFSGIPIIVSDIPAHREFFRGCAFFVDPDDHRSSVTLVHRLINSPLSVKNRIKKGRRLSSLLRWKSITDKIFSLYDE